MLDALMGSKTGLLAQQLRIATISNNLANVNTAGFKRSRVSFAELMPQPASTAFAVAADAHGGGRVGYGTSVTAVDAVFDQGDLRETGRSMDLAINGRGFLEVQREDGQLGYTRMGDLKLDDRGRLVTTEGLLLSGGIQVPSEAMAVTVRADGSVYATVQNRDEPLFIGQLELADVVNPEGLRALGGGLYEVTEASGPAFYGVPGEFGLGKVQQGFLEGSNVDFVEELIELTLAQRAYELNARVVQAADQILSTINALRR